jgi:hypothetical protein
MAVMDDSRSGTLAEKSSPPPSRDGEKSALPSTHENQREEEAAAAASSTPDSYAQEKAGLEEVKVSAEDGSDLKKIRTSDSNVEYPTGVKLGLISLALCLSVFLMALVC